MTDFPLVVSMSQGYLGGLDSPAHSQTYRKAIIQSAPFSFTVRVLPPTKQGANYHFGLRVIPTQSTRLPPSPQRTKRLNRHSTRSTREAAEYEIWRRWEDCLDFQRTLEVEYHTVSKRRRKGEPALNHHAKDMLYPSQRAASFESLPLGPDPSTIPVDVHAHIPRLSKKSTLFRVNESVIQQRGEEFKAMIEALFDEDAPSTLQELCTVSTVRDFFGYWRRDREAERKMNKTPLISSATSSPSHQGKGGDLSKQSSVLSPELIAFAAGGNIAASPKPKHPPTGRSPHTTSNGLREAQQVVFDPGYALSPPTPSAFAQKVSHILFSSSAAVTDGGPQRRRPPSSRPVDLVLLRSPALVNVQSQMPILDSPSPHTSTPTSSGLDGFSRLRQSSSPQILPAGNPASLLPPHSTPAGNGFFNPDPFAHPMQGRTVSMPAQKRHRDGQMTPTTGVLPAPIPRRRNGAIDISGNRSARFFDASTDVGNGPPPQSPKPSEGKGETNVNTGYLQGHPQQSSQSQAEVTASERPVPSIALSQTESRESHGGSEASTPPHVQTLLSTGCSTSIVTPHSSPHSSAAAPHRHRTAPSWGSRRMSLDSLAPIDLELYSKETRPLYVTNPRLSLSSDSSYTDGGMSDAALAHAPSASMPSLILPLKIQPSSALLPPSPPPPRPPRSALRSSSTISCGRRTSVASSPAASLLTPAEDGAPVSVDIEPPQRVSTNRDIVDADFETPSAAKSEDPFELEFRPQPPPTPVHRARRKANSAGTGHSIAPIMVPPLPPFLPPESVSPFSLGEVQSGSPATPLMGQATTIKAIHEASSTILLFRVSRMSTSLAELRAKLSRKFMEAENIQMVPEQLELRYLSPASIGPNRPRPTGGAASSNERNRSVSVTSTHGAHGLWLSLNTEADWRTAAATSSGKVTVKVF